MDKHIIEAATQADIDKINQAAFEIHKDRMATDGYSSDAQGIIGKNAATGEDEPDKQRTTSWGEPQESPDNTFYITELPDMKAAELTKIDKAAANTRKLKPQAWIVEAQLEGSAEELKNVS